MKRPLLNYDIYRSYFNNEYLRPLDIQINLDQFHRDIDKYKTYFRRWGKNHLQYPRYGISLVNLTGNIHDDVDPACWPLDEWQRHNPRCWYTDHDFKRSTIVLSEPCFDPITCLKTHMLRSNILLWHNTGHFKPHIDMLKGRIDHLRLWGVSSDKYKLYYQDSEYKNWQPGQLYLIDVTSRHWAEATADDVYTFFIAVDLTAQKIIEGLLI